MASAFGFCWCCSLCLSWQVDGLHSLACWGFYRRITQSPDKIWTATCYRKNQHLCKQKNCIKLKREIESDLESTTQASVFVQMSVQVLLVHVLNARGCGKCFVWKPRPQFILCWTQPVRTLADVTLAQESDAVAAVNQFYCKAFFTASEHTTELDECRQGCT